jgi:hypothetical protein
VKWNRSVPLRCTRNPHRPTICSVYRVTDLEPVPVNRHRFSRIASIFPDFPEYFQNIRIYLLSYLQSIVGDLFTADPLLLATSKLLGVYVYSFTGTSCGCDRLSYSSRFHSHKIDRVESSPPIYLLSKIFICCQVTERLRMGAFMDSGKVSYGSCSGKRVARRRLAVATPTGWGWSISAVTEASLTDSFRKHIMAAMTGPCAGLAAPHASNQVAGATVEPPLLNEASAMDSARTDSIG